MRFRYLDMPVGTVVVDPARGLVDVLLARDGNLFTWLYLVDDQDPSREGFVEDHTHAKDEETYDNEEVLLPEGG